MITENAPSDDLVPIAEAAAQGHADFLADGGEMAERIRAFDWASTPLGPMSSWSSALRMMVRFLLANRFPLLLWWGPQYVSIYNDPYRPVLGAKHPWALGKPVRECWSEIWHVLQPLIDTPFLGGPATWNDDIQLEINRYGYIEETHFVVAYSPVPDETTASGIGGVLATVHEISATVVSDRRVIALRDLGARTSEAKTAAQACAIAAEIMSRHPLDIPFAMLYLNDANSGVARLAGTAGVEAGTCVSPAEIAIGDEAIWPLHAALKSGTTEVVERLGDGVPAGPWSDPPSQAVVVPIRSNIPHHPAGFLVAGVSTRLKFDDAYRGFYELVGGQIATSIASATAYEEERRRAEMLADIDRAKTAFFSNVSHEFRTPLTLILGPLEEALSRPERTLAGENLDATHRNALRLLKLVNALLDFSRIEAGRVEARFQPVDLAAATGDLASVFRSAIERAGLRFIVRCDPLPETVYVDSEMWEKVVLNLLSNALKFTFEGEIELLVRAAGQRAELVVRDTGVGVPADELPRLFERFHRIAGQKARTFEGSGIGLALVQELIRMHGGEIHAASDVDKGTTFTVSIPFGAAHLPRERVHETQTTPQPASCAAAYLTEASRWSPDELPAAETAPPRSARVLVADDNADMRNYLRGLLRERWNVETVNDGEAALAALRREHFDLVLADVMMPRLDGFGLLREVRGDAATRSIPVIMLSARAGEESRVEGLGAGADDYIVKPFSAREVVARVAAHLEMGRLRREAELQRKHLASLFMQAPMPIVILRGPDYVIELANEQACEVARRTREEIIGRPLSDVLPAGRIRSLRNLLDDVRNNGVTHVGKEVLVKIDRDDAGTPDDVYFNFVYAPMRDVDGATDGILVTAFDVTDEVLARKSMSDLREQAEAANRAKDEFLAMLGHELRTPLTSMVGWSNMLRMGLVEPAKQAEALQAIERAAKAQSQLIEDLLDISRISSGKLRLNVQPVDLIDVIQAAVAAVRPAADSSSIRLQVTLDQQVAPIAGDPDRLQQIVWNLISNAVKFTPEKGRIQIRLERVDSHVEITIADTGKGIAPEFLPHIFERFRQAESSFNRTHGGLGLGLSIVRSLVELHGGTITAQSPGENLGSTFVVRLPVMIVQDQKRSPLELLRFHPAAEADVAFECPPELDGLRVLIVEDDADGRRMLASILERCHCTTVAASSAAEACEVLETFRPNVLLSDIEMPVEDGYALIRRLRSNGISIPAAALTAHARTEDQVRALRAGFDMHVSKPIQPAELVTVIASLARRK